ncbi:DUF4145 domain-containing protein [bacterium]|nr:MAG: DUF4145 domain-containing protein [bacterium]
MEKYITVNYNGNPRALEIPNICPRCQQHVDIQTSQCITLKDTLGQAVFLCVNHKCNSYFIAYYDMTQLNGNELIKVVPEALRSDEFSTTIKSLSPTFIHIYSQAQNAKQLGLNHIFGPGFRKAFEFLIKDYAKSTIPDNDSKEIPQIEQSFSGEVVNNYISDPRIQQLAKRALWLGNDETHYLRIWTEHDADDLLALIKLTIYYIESDILAKEYEKDMSPKK